MFISEILHHSYKNSNKFWQSFSVFLFPNETPTEEAHDFASWPFGKKGPGSSVLETLKEAVCLFLKAKRRGYLLLQVVYKLPQLADIGKKRADLITHEEGNGVEGCRRALFPIQKPIKDPGHRDRPGEGYQHDAKNRSSQDVTQIVDTQVDSCRAHNRCADVGKKPPAPVAKEDHGRQCEINARMVTGEGIPLAQGAWRHPDRIFQFEIRVIKRPDMKRKNVLQYSA